MARTKCQNTVRLFLKLFLFVAIIQENLGGPMATATATGDTSVPPFEVELSSPVPFTTRKPEISNKEAEQNKDNERANADSSQSSNAVNSSSSALPPAPIPPKGFEAANSKDLNNEDLMNTNYDDDYIETDLKPEHTTPTSMEQQDGPIIPSTTITFRNVAAAGILGDSNSNIDGVGGNGTPITINDATPPYAAVDEKYGKNSTDIYCTRSDKDRLTEYKEYNGPRSRY